MMPGPDMFDIFLNIGAAGSRIAGFINVGPFESADLCCDVTQGLPYADRSVAGINCEDFIDSLDQAQGAAFLRECRRVLKSDGVLRIATADLDAMLAAYASDDWHAQVAQDDFEWIDNRAEFLNAQFARRQWLYNGEELIRLARFAGLSRVDEPGEKALFGGRATGVGTGIVVQFTRREHVLDAHPLVSIVIPAYRARFFREAIESALAQTYQNIEILVLDDSGNDDIFKITEATMGPASPVRYIKNSPPLGEAASLTRGIGEARGSLIKPLYDDDRLTPDAVAQLARAMQQCPGATLAMSRRNTIDANGAIMLPEPLFLANGSCEIDGVSLAAFTLLAGNFIGPPSSVMFRRADALVIAPHVMVFAGRFTRGTGDVALYLNLLSGGDAVFVSEVLSDFRLHDDHTSSDPAVQQQARTSWQYLRVHGTRLGLMTPEPSIKIKRGFNI